jgi:hypothetical protein
VADDIVGRSEFRPPRYVLARAVRTRPGGDPNRREDCEHGWYATYHTTDVVGPDLHLVGHIQWGRGARTRAQQDACRLQRRWTHRLRRYTDTLHADNMRYRMEREALTNGSASAADVGAQP